MVITEKIQEYIQKLPVSIQSEVLDYVEYLLSKTEHVSNRQEDRIWSKFSISSALRGMENDNDPIYTTSDLKEIYG